MTGLGIVSGEFTIGTAPELRFTPSGTAVATFRGVANSRKFDRDANKWVDDKTSWQDFTVFGPLAEKFMEGDPQKKDSVVVIGRLEVQEYDDREGRKQKSPTILVDHIGMSCRFSPVKVQRVERTREPAQSGWGS